MIRQSLPDKCIETGPVNHVHLATEDGALARESLHIVLEQAGRKGLVLKPCVSLHSINPWHTFEEILDEWRKIR